MKTCNTIIARSCNFFTGGTVADIKYDRPWLLIMCWDKTSTWYQVLKICGFLTEACFKTHHRQIGYPTKQAVTLMLCLQSVSPQLSPLNWNCYAELITAPMLRSYWAGGSGKWPWVHDKQYRNEALKDVTVSLEQVLRSKIKKKMLRTLRLSVHQCVYWVKSLKHTPDLRAMQNTV